jgi:hypothetical protein
MDDKPKSIWKKNWSLPRSVLGRVISVLGRVIVLTALALLVTPLAAVTISGVARHDLMPVVVVGVISAVVILLFLLVRWMFRPRNRRRVLFGFACLITLIALFYAEEDWRGWHAWKKFKTEWEAKGEKFDRQSVVPPPVPNDQNFAVTPIVASCYEMYFDKTGHELRPRNTNVVDRLWFLELYHRRGQSPSPKVEPHLGNWQAGEMTDLKAWQNYYRSPNEGLSAHFFTNVFPVAARPQTPAQDVLLALSKYDSTIEELREAARLPYSRFPLEYDKENPTAVLLPHLTALRRCTQVLQLRAIAELQDGQSEKVLADLKLLLRLADSTRTEPFLVSHLVRMAMLQIALQPVWEGLADQKWTDTQLAMLDAEFVKLDFLTDYSRVIRAVAAFSAVCIEAIPQWPEIYYLAEEPNIRDVPKSVKFIFRAFPRGWYCQNELFASRYFLERAFPLCDPQQQRVYPGLSWTNSTFLKQVSVTPYNFMAKQLIALATVTPLRFARVHTHINLARIACGLERYRLAHGQFPESLDALEPQFIAKLPQDIMIGQPLHYRRTDDGKFLLYSVGWNQKDEGGQVALNKDGSEDLENGDWIWRYPAK